MTDRDHRFDWACTISGKEWRLGVVERTGIHSTVASVERLRSGKWRWLVFCEPYNHGGREPSRQLAMDEAERQLAGHGGE